MPELPEVEALRRYLLRERLTGLRITRVEARWPNTERTEDGLGGLSGLAGSRISSVDRHGKQLLVRLDKGVLGLHMGMTGSLAVRKSSDPSLKYAHTVFHVDDGRRVELDDPRRWASVVLVEDPSELRGSLGPDALDPAFDAAVFIRRVKPRRGAIKAVLLDQHVLAGVGNIYADEALFRSHISPLRPASGISTDRLHLLHAAIKTTLTQAIDFIESHLLDDGRPQIVDAYDKRMRLSRRSGARCPECWSLLATAKVGGRTSYFCRSCQR